jgi:[acyl-carrier-protein] S-malonyltransferase
MESAQIELSEAIAQTPFHEPIAPIYQNVNAKPSRDVSIIKQNLVAQLTGPVRWTQTVENMIADGATEFIEVGQGKVLQGLVKKVDRKMEVSSLA